MSAWSLDGKVALVTGGNSGIGLETAVGLVKEGARVRLTARSTAKGEGAVAQVLERTGASADRVTFDVMDLASLRSVKELAQRLLDQEPALHLLVNNAGLIVGDRRETKDGFEATFGINHLGHFRLTQLLLPLLKSSAPARVINLASTAHRRSPGLDFDDLQRTRRRYSSLAAYGDAKLANILFTVELARRLEGSGVSTFAVHPGVVRTGFASKDDVGGLMALAAKVIFLFAKTPAQGAECSLHVARTPDIEDRSGTYWSDCKVSVPRPPARDVAAAERLWRVSEELVGR